MSDNMTNTKRKPQMPVRSTRLVRRGESVTVWNFKLERFQRVRGRKATLILDAIMSILRSAPNDKLSHGHPTTKKDTI